LLNSKNHAAKRHLQSLPQTAEAGPQHCSGSFGP
jgi:hypothetical protein